MKDEARGGGTHARHSPAMACGLMMMVAVVVVVGVSGYGHKTFDKGRKRYCFNGERQVKEPRPSLHV